MAIGATKIPIGFNKVSPYWTPQSLISSSGNGTTVTTVILKTSLDITITLDGLGRFYSDVAGTLNESTSWNVVAGANRTMYMRCPSGTANMTFSDKSKVTSFYWQGTGGHNPSISDDIRSFTKLEVLEIDTSNTLRGELSGLSTLQFIRVSTGTLMTLSRVVSMKGLSYLYWVGTAIFHSPQVNQLLADFVTNKDEAKPLTQRTINLSWGQPAIGQGLIDRDALRLYRSPNSDGSKDLWTVTTNERVCKMSLTFDDGLASFITYGYPVFEAKGIKVSTCVISDYVGTDNSRWLTWAQILTLQTNGYDFLSHSKDHVDLRGLTATQLRANFQGFNDACAANGMTRPTKLAYPFGLENATVQSVAAEFYNIGRKNLGAGFNVAGQNLFAIPSGNLNILDQTTLDAVKASIYTAWENTNLLILSGHDIYPDGGAPISDYGVYAIRVSYLEAIIDYIKSLGIDIISLETMMNTYLLTAIPSIPTISSAVIANSNPANVVITFNQNLNTTSLPATTDFALAGKTISAINVTGAIVTLTVSVAYAYGDAVTVNYTKPASLMLKSVTGGYEVASFTGQAVINNIVNTYTLQDTFTDANGTLLSAHAMNVGAGWTAAASWTIQNNKATCNATTGAI